jgi:hypothetical protein
MEHIEGNSNGVKLYTILKEPLVIVKNDKL